MRRVLLLAVLLSACAHKPTPMPPWVKPGTGIFLGTPPTIRGVGNSVGIRDEDQRPDAARIRAAAELARTLDKISAAVVGPAPGQQMNEAMTLFVARAFKHGQLTDVWVSGDDVCYAMDQLDYDAFRAAFVQWAQADARRAGLVARLDAFFHQVAVEPPPPPPAPPVQPAP